MCILLEGALDNVLLTRLLEAKSIMMAFILTLFKINTCIHGYQGPMGRVIVSCTNQDDIF